MKIKRILFIAVTFLLSLRISAQGTIIDHNCTKINDIPESAILAAKNNLHIAYGHTSHGSQLITGMNNLDAFMGGTGLYDWHNGIEEGSLDIDDYFVSGDLGNPDRTTWAEQTRNYLNDSQNSDVNVVIWSWCGEVSSASEDDINTYLNLMNSLETDFPNVNFIYMTGHLDGSGLEGNLHIRNEQIRNYCKTNNKILYDFNDIECYDPDGNYFGDKYPNDNCDYDSDGDGSKDTNWAIEWQNSHSEDIDWYNCSAAHSQPLNGNQKAYAAWWLWATLAGWQGISYVSKSRYLINEITLGNNYPNPFNPTTTINFSIKNNLHIRLDIFNTLGECVSTLINKNFTHGNYSITWNGKDNFKNDVNSGVYIYRLSSENFSKSKTMILLK